MSKIKLDFDAVVTGLKTWSDQVSQELIYKKLMENSILSKFETIATTDGTVDIPVVSPAITLQAAGCSLSSAGDDTFTQISVTSTKSQVFKKLCRNDFNAKMIANAYDSIFDDSKIPYEQIIIDATIDKIKDNMESGWLLGTSATDSTYRVKGLVATLSGNTSVIEASSATDTSVTGVTTSINNMIAAMPFEMLAKQDLCLIVNYAVYFRIIQALNENYKYFTATQVNNFEGISYPLMPNLKIVPVKANIGTRMILTYYSNIVKTVDKSGESMTATAIYVDKEDAIYYNYKIFQGYSPKFFEHVVVNFDVN